MYSFVVRGKLILAKKTKLKVKIPQLTLGELAQMDRQLAENTKV